MKTVKGLLLGSGAALFALSGAHAADLTPVQPVQYVKVCDAYGAGFFYIPGTDTCLKISGFAQGQLRYDPVASRSFSTATLHSTDNAINFRARGEVDFDVRTQSPWGTVRAYVGLGAYFSSNFVQYGPIWYGAPTTRPGFTNPGDVTDVFISNAYVQFAGLTAGYTLSNFEFPFGFPESIIEPFAALQAPGQFQVAYTADFGGGFSATLALEDASSRRANLWGGFGPPAASTLAYAGERMPDIVANLRIVQGWGAAQLSGAVHQTRGAGLAAAAFGAPGGSWDTNYGFAIQGGVAINLPMLAQGDKFTLTAVYADGAMGYVGWGPQQSNFFTWFNGALGPGLADAWYGVDGKLHNETAWQITASLKHYWTPTLRSNFIVAYDNFDVPTSAVTGLGGPGFATSASDQRFLTAAVNLIWSPVPNLDLGLEAFNQTGFKNAAQKSLFRVGPTSGNYLNSRWTFVSWITRKF